jgi:hypothetical protein
MAGAVCHVPTGRPERDSSRLISVDMALGSRSGVVFFTDAATFVVHIAEIVRLIERWGAAPTVSGPIWCYPSTRLDELVENRLSGRDVPVVAGERQPSAQGDRAVEAFA